MDLLQLLVKAVKLPLQRAGKTLCQQNNEMNKGNLWIPGKPVTAVF